VKAIVLGAGVIGVTAAYYLAKAGAQVTVIDRQLDVARETSFANGGQLSVRSARPWANPHAPGVALRSLGRADAPLIMRLRADPAMWCWVLKFLRNCTPRRARHNLALLRRIAAYSGDSLAALCADKAIAFDRHQGVLCLYRDRRNFDEAARELDGAEEMERAVTPAECARIEPALAEAEAKLSGGIYYPKDESGDARRFTEELAAICREQGVAFTLGTNAVRILATGDRVAGIETDDGVERADAYLLCLGSFSPRLARGLGIRLPIYPVKGYSVTIPVASQNVAPEVSIHDGELKIVISRLGDRLRAAGTAELTGYDARIDPVRSQAVLKGLLSLFPNSGDPKKATFWAGLRPMTPDGLPILGATRCPNLFLNTGHGTLGFTLGCGSGRVAADLVMGREPAIDLTGLGLERFS
jgi:D-amino-acid dehydrogenase